MEGQQLSHYTIVAKIGQGGMGAVYRAVDTRLNRTVALKVLPPQASADPDRKRRFVQEAQSASALNHPNIVNIYETDCVDGIDFIAMEYVDGEALDKIIDRARGVSPMPPSATGMSNSRNSGDRNQPNDTLSDPLPGVITEASSSHELKFRTPADGWTCEAPPLNGVPCLSVPVSVAVPLRRSGRGGVESETPAEQKRPRHRHLYEPICVL